MAVSAKMIFDSRGDWGFVFSAHSRPLLGDCPEFWRKKNHLKLSKIASVYGV